MHQIILSRGITMKKTYIYIAVATVIGFTAAFALLGNGTGKALAVNDVGSDPAAFSGTITITGIAAGVAPQDPTVFGLVDTRELKCTTPNCNKIVIPVKHAGGLPKPGDEVRLTGAFVNQGKGYYFASTKLKVLRNHKIGG
jgi:hypothetical protein